MQIQERVQSSLCARSSCSGLPWQPRSSERVALHPELTQHPLHPAPSHSHSTLGSHRQGLQESALCPAGLSCPQGGCVFHPEQTQSPQGFFPLVESLGCNQAEYLPSAALLLGGYRSPEGGISLWWGWLPLPALCHMGAEELVLLA